MREVLTPEGQGFFRIPLAVMQAGTLAPVDIYTWASKTGRTVLYKSAGASFYEGTRRRLLERGVKALYLRKSDERTYHRYVEENISAIIQDELLPLPEACQMVYESSSRVMKDVFQNPRSGQNVPRAQAVVQATVDAILKEPDALWFITSLASHDYRTYTHCVNVCAFLVATCKAILNISDPESLKQIGYGALLHDVGMSEIPDAILRKHGRLTPEEFEQVKQHPLLGLDIAMGLKHLPEPAARIIRWHHERLDGSGYPDGVKGKEIGPIVRLACILDVYDALTTDRPYAKAKTPPDALKLMLDELSGRLDEKVMRWFIEFLGPRPGGLGCARE